MPRAPSPIASCPGFASSLYKKVMNLEDLQANARRASALLKAMSNERRLMILCQLAEGEKSVGALQALVGLSQSALSQHLARLRRDNLVKTRRSAQTIFYSLANADAHTVMEALYRLYCGGKAKPAGQRHSTKTTASVRAGLRQ